MFFNKIFKKTVIDYDFCINLEEKEYPKYLMEIFKLKMGYKFNLKAPKTLNEIIQYLKIYDNIPIKAELTDKTKVNDFVEKSLNTTKYRKEVYGIYESIDNIDFSNLPKRFIIKRNNSSKINMRCFNKYINTDVLIERIKSHFKKYQDINYAFVSGFELQYKNIPTKYIVERLYPKIEEYQFVCTKGVPILLSIVEDETIALTTNFVISNGYKIEGNVKDNDKVQKMLELASELSKEFIFVRVDFMLVNKQYIFFQELTFTPYSGFASYVDEYNDKKIAQFVLKNLNK